MLCLKKVIIIQFKDVDAEVWFTTPRFFAFYFPCCLARRRKIKPGFFSSEKSSIRLQRRSDFMDCPQMTVEKQLMCHNNCLKNLLKTTRTNKLQIVCSSLVCKILYSLMFRDIFQTVLGNWWSPLTYVWHASSIQPEETTVLSGCTAFFFLFQHSAANFTS